MRNAKLFGIFVVLLMLTIGVSGCINQEPTDVQDEMTENPEDGVNGKTTQLPNPAAVYCERDKGGVHQSVETELGSTGYCSLPDGRTCEAWPFYNSSGVDCIPYEA